MRKGLIVLLSLGVVGGFGSGFARLAHRGGCHGGSYERWSYAGNRDGELDRYERFGNPDRFDRFERGPAPVAAPAPVQQQQAPVYIVIPQAQSAAPIIVNGAPSASQAAPANVIVVPQAAAPAAIPQLAPAAK